jgi:hypothetical protein
MANLSMSGVGSGNLVRSGSHDLAGQTHATRHLKEHLAPLPLLLGMVSGFAMGLSASFQSGFRPRPRALSPMHSAAPILHRRTATRRPGARFRAASGAVVEIAGRVAMAKPPARAVLGWF